MFNKGTLINLTIFVLFVTLSNIVSAADIYVTPLVSATAGNGTLSSPYNSVVIALSVAQPGDVVRLLPGIYSGPINLPRGGTLDKPITLMSDGSARSSIIDCQGRLVNCVETNYGNVIIDGLEVRNSGYNGIKVDGDLYGAFDINQSYGRYAGNSSRYNYANGADNIVIKNNYVNNIGYDGIKISHTNNIALINNEIYKTGTVHLTSATTWQQGIDMVGVYNSIISGNYIHDDIQNPIMAVGMFVKGGSENIIIENNLVENIVSPNAAIEIGGDTEWYNTRYTPANIPGLNDRILTEDNLNNEINRVGTYATSNTYTNKYLSEARNVIVRGNIVKNSDPAFSVRNGYNTRIYNNTVIDCGWSQSWIKLWNDGTSIHRTENTLIYNNIFNNIGIQLSIQGRYRDKSIGTEYDNIQGFKADNNIFWNTGLTTISGLGAYAPLGMDVNSMTIDPLIDDNYKPVKGSPTIDAGLDLVLNEIMGVSDIFVDRYNTVRPKNLKYDIGAIEEPVTILEPKNLRRIK